MARLQQSVFPLSELPNSPQSDSWFQHYKTCCSSSAAASMCGTQYTLFWPWNEVSWDGVKPALYKWYTIWCHNMLHVYYRRWLAEGVGDGGGTMHNKWVTTLDMGETEQKLMKAIKRDCVFTNKMINDRAKQLLDVHRTEQEIIPWKRAHHGKSDSHRLEHAKACSVVNSATASSHVFIMHETRISYIYVYAFTYACTDGKKWTNMNFTSGFTAEGKKKLTFNSLKQYNA